VIVEAMAPGMPRTSPTISTVLLDLLLDPPPVVVGVAIKDENENDDGGVD